MKLTRVLAIGVIASSLGLGAAVHAQSLKNVSSPAEYPPLSYKGKQYVDSRGCVYIRAGVDGDVTWVPRMTRERKVVCGMKPINVSGATKTQPAPKLDKNVVTITAAESEAGAPKEAVPAAKTTPVKTVKKAPRPVAAAVPKSVTQKPVAAPVPKKVVKSAAKQPAWKRPRRTVNQAPRNSGAESRCRAGSTYNGLPVRCGPQAELPYSPGTGTPTAPAPVIRIDRHGALMGAQPGEVVKKGEVGPHVRVVPRHVYENRTYAMVEVTPPPGYARVFDDGRLNPYRAEQTFAGMAAMDQIWKKKLPRRLIVAETGAVVSTKSAPVVSTKNASEKKKLRLAGQPYVQVATYNDAAVAQGVARKVRALGLPVRIGVYAKGGVTKRMVLVGPLADQTAAEGAAGTLRSAGFSGAFVRG